MRSCQHCQAGAAPADRLGRIAEQLAALAAEAPAFSAQEAGWLLRAARLIADRGGEVRLAIDGQAVTAPGPVHRPLDPSARVRNAGPQPISDVLTVAETDHEAGPSSAGWAWQLLAPGGGGLPAPDRVDAERWSIPTVERIASRPPDRLERPPRA